MGLGGTALSSSFEFHRPYVDNADVSSLFLSCVTTLSQDTQNSACILKQLQAAGFCECLYTMWAFSFRSANFGVPIVTVM